MTITSTIRRRGLLATLASATLLATTLLFPGTANAADACAPGYDNNKVYVAGNTTSYQGHNWRAKWWTKSENPSTGGSGVWADAGTCSGGSGGGTGGGTGTTCTHPNWAAGTFYPVGSIVKYTNGQYYKAVHENPGYDPIISTWFWQPFTCTGTTNPPNPPTDPGTSSGFPVSEAQFNQMFPQRIGFYSYAGLIDATKKFPAFTGTGDAQTRKREAAAFLANIDHESGQLRYVEEINQANWPLYCDASQPYGCPAGQSAYHGRGPIQLSWNFNYKAAGDALGIDLLRNPDLVKTNSSIAYQTAVWYWMTQSGPNSQTAHSAITGSQGFGGTIRSINGALECDGRNPATVQNRVATYERFAQILGVDPGANRSC